MQIARVVVNDPQAVEVQVVTQGEGTIRRLYVASSDAGKVIGKERRTARSMRISFGAVSMKLHHRCTLEIPQDEGAAKLAVPTVGIQKAEARIELIRHQHRL